MPAGIGREEDQVEQLQTSHEGDVLGGGVGEVVEYPVRIQPADNKVRAGCRGAR